MPACSRGGSNVLGRRRATRLQITVESSFWDGTTGKVVGRLPDTRTVNIPVSQVREDATYVKLRIEPFGDRMRSQGIQARIAGAIQEGS